MIFDGIREPTWVSHERSRLMRQSAQKSDVFA
jgi:hypothetical protein